MSVQFTYDTPVREMIALGKYNNGGFESDLLRYKMPVELQGEVAMPHLYHPGKAIWPDAGNRSIHFGTVLSSLPYISADQLVLGVYPQG